MAPAAAFVTAPPAAARGLGVPRRGRRMPSAAATAVVRRPIRAAHPTPRVTPAAAAAMATGDTDGAADGGSGAPRAVTRRGVLAAAAAAAIAAALGGGAAGVAVCPRPASAAAAPPGPFVLPPLPYEASALEPAIDAATMTVHHDKHFAAYTAKLNAALAKAGLADVVTDDASLRRLLGNPLLTSPRGGSWDVNHTLFFSSMTSPAKAAKPSVVMCEAIDGTFGSFDKMRTEFTSAATALFGSGWVWLSVDTAGGNRVRLTTTANQDVPWAASPGLVPILGLDVWEHAYYLQYKNRRPDYVEAWWSVVDWAAVERRYEEAIAMNA
ncbi:hypothetical protein MMPV_003494 [Pyropia vietnamensis]